MHLKLQTTFFYTLLHVTGCMHIVVAPCDIMPSQCICVNFETLNLKSSVQFSNVDTLLRFIETKHKHTDKKC